MPKDKTIAVIGGGLAGLAAARWLGLQGMAVKLYEANGKLGGCCATTRVEGYTFNDGEINPGQIYFLYFKNKRGRRD